MKTAIALLFIASIAFSVITEDVTISLNSDGMAHETISIDLQNNSASEIIVPLLAVESNIQNFVASGATFSLEQRNGVYIARTTSPATKFTLDFDANFIAAKLVEIDNEKNSLLYYAPVSNNDTYLKLKVQLPKDAVPIEVQPGKSMVLNPNPLISETAWTDRFELSWSWLLGNGDAAVVMLNYKLPVSPTPATDYSVIIGIAALLVGLGIGVVLIKITKRKVRREGLSEEEKTVLEFVKSKGETTQDEIRGAFAFSKPKLSRLLRSMEIKKAIRKEPYKNTNKVYLD